MMSLDSRQRAMLEEMGVKVWWPRPDAASAAPVEASKMIAAQARGTGVTARFGIQIPKVSPLRSPPVASAPGAALATAAGLWLEAEAQRLYAGDAAPQGGWLVVADMPPGPAGRHGEPFAGDAGRLLDNMLRALQLDRSGAPVHLLRVHRGAPGDGRSCPLAAGFAAQAEALAPRLVLALGSLAAQYLFESGEPLGKLRGRVGALAGRPGTALVASYPPAYLLRNQADKARAWADLCLAAAAFER